jgi:hypothetical protein
MIAESRSLDLSSPRKRGSSGARDDSVFECSFKHNSLPAKNKGGSWPPLLKSEVRCLTPVLRWRRSLSAFGASGLEVWLNNLLYSVVGLDRRHDLG